MERFEFEEQSAAQLDTLRTRLLRVQHTLPTPESPPRRRRSSSSPASGILRDEFAALAQETSGAAADEPGVHRSEDEGSPQAHPQVVKASSDAFQHPVSGRMSGIYDGALSDAPRRRPSIPIAQNSAAAARRWRRSSAGDHLNMRRMIATAVERERSSVPAAPTDEDAKSSKIIPSSRQPTLSPVFPSEPVLNSPQLDEDMWGKEFVGYPTPAPGAVAGLARVVARIAEACGLQMDVLGEDVEESESDSQRPDRSSPVPQRPGTATPLGDQAASDDEFDREPPHPPALAESSLRFHSSPAVGRSMPPRRVSLASMPSGVSATSHASRPSADIAAASGLDVPPGPLRRRSATEPATHLVRLRWRRAATKDEPAGSPVAPLENERSRSRSPVSVSHQAQLEHARGMVEVTGEDVALLVELVNYAASAVTMEQIARLGAAEGDVSPSVTELHLRRAARRRSITEDSLIAQMRSLPQIFDAATAEYLMEAVAPQRHNSFQGDRSRPKDARKAHSLRRRFRAMSTVVGRMNDLSRKVRSDLTREEAVSRVLGPDTDLRVEEVNVHVRRADVEPLPERLPPPRVLEQERTIVCSAGESWEFDVISANRRVLELMSVVVRADDVRIHVSDEEQQQDSWGTHFDTVTQPWMLAGGRSREGVGAELLPIVGYHAARELFEVENDSNCAGIDWGAFRRLLMAVARKYRDNPYHSALHASDVVSAVWFMLSPRGGGLAAHIAPTTRLAMCLAAAAHDVGHIGVNNVYLTRMGHPLALLYNDASPLENFHAALLFQLMREVPDCAFLRETEGGFVEGDVSHIRRAIIEMVVSTDNSKHFQLIGDAEERINEVEDAMEMMARAHPHQPQEPLPESAYVLPGGMDLSPGSKDEGMVTKLVLHACDISNATRPWYLANRWSDFITQEFFNQGDRERRRGLPVGPMNDRNTSTPKSKFAAGFAMGLVRPLFQLLDRLPCIDVAQPLRLLQGNIDRWAELSHAADSLPKPAKADEHEGEGEGGDGGDENDEDGEGGEGGEGEGEDAGAPPPVGRTPPPPPPAAPPAPPRPPAAR